MCLLIFTAIYLLVAFFLINWDNLKKYYPTIQYYVICNSLYNVLFYNHTLWEYRPGRTHWLNHTVIDLIFSLLIVPVAIYFYLHFLPEGKKQIIYIAGWVSLFTMIEVFFHRKGLFVYHNGWNEKWSFLFDIILFTILRIHYQNYRKALLLSVPIAAILLWFFHPSFSELK
jgi:hypothetical protein